MKPPPFRLRPAHIAAAAVLFVAACQEDHAPTVPDLSGPSLAKSSPPTSLRLPSDGRATPSGLVAWWRGDGDASDVTGIHGGALRGDASFAPGHVGESFTFGGVGEVVVPYHPALNLQTLSATAWVMPSGLDGDIDIILNKEYRDGIVSLIQYEIGVRGSHNPGIGAIPVGNLAFHFRAVGIPREHAGWADGYANIPLNTWTHVAMTFDGSTARILVNGDVTRTVTGLRGPLPISEGPLKIGSRSDWTVDQNPWERWEGGIDDVMLFDRALAPVEVRLIYLRGLVGGLVTEGALNSGQGNALLAKVATAQEKLEQANARAAVNALGALLNQLAAWGRSGVLTAEKAGLLADVVAAAIGDLA